MRRTILLSGLASFFTALLGSTLALTLVVPAIVGAQQSGVRAEEVVVTGSNGVERVRLQTGPGGASSGRLLDANGVGRSLWSTGGQSRGDDPDAAGISFSNGEGRQVVRLGTGRGPDSTGPLRQSLILSDQQGRQRARILVAEDGTPAIELLDATGAVIWSAP